MCVWGSAVIVGLNHPLPPSDSVCQLADFSAVEPLNANINGRSPEEPDKSTVEFLLKLAKKFKTLESKDISMK